MFVMSSVLLVLYHISSGVSSCGLTCMVTILLLPNALHERIAYRLITECAFLVEYIL